MTTGLRLVTFLFFVNAFLACNVFAQSADADKGNSSSPSAEATNTEKPLTPKRVRVNQGVLKPIHRVYPTYPESGSTTGNGMVSLRVIIATDGTVKDVQLINGDDRLAPSAIAAVKQWKYKPMSVNGSPVEVETRVDVKFLPH